MQRNKKCGPYIGNVLPIFKASGQERGRRGREDRALGNVEYYKEENCHL